ncbi:MAG: adenylyltransferase/cytidyltransferase family protein [Arthrobacter sp.]|jgi:glycerol-3-phosphate cytidylyltransferase|nr:adenylyltransferase/cytidyltransferase family protein [Arthrobacter sp.]
MGGLVPGAGGRTRSGRIGYAAGAFDLFHVGHLNLLRRSAERCDHLVAGVVSDAVLWQTKGILPVIGEDERAAIVGALACVDAVYIERDADRLVTWDDVRFSLFFKGDDWLGTPRAEALQAQLATRGARIEYLPYTLETSSSRLRAALADLETMARAARG